MIDNFKVSFIGFGLIGGTIAKALKTNYKCTITVFNHRSTAHPLFEKAKEDGIVDVISTDLKEVSDTDLIFLCAPVLKNLDYLEEICPFIRKNTLITDVGSVKGNIVKKAAELNISSQFLGGHPMAGLEKTGYGHADEKLLNDCTYVITPSEANSQEQIDWLYNFVSLSKANPLIMSPTEHDMITAGISHAPHVISASLVNTVDDLDEKGLFRQLAAGGFKDITRISSSSPEMWRDICLANPDEILSFIGSFKNELEGIEDAIKSGDNDKIQAFFEKARTYRSTFER